MMPSATHPRAPVDPQPGGTTVATATVQAAPSAPAPPEDADDRSTSLLGRVRGLFLVLVWLLVAVEVVELVDARTPLWPDRALAAVALAATGVLAEVVRRIGWRAGACDVAAVGGLVIAGIGLGRVGAVLVLLVGLGMLRVLYGSRRSAALGVASLVVGYALVGLVLEGPSGLLDLHYAVVSLGLGALAGVLRHVGEAVAVHDVAASWERDLAATARRALTVTDQSRLELLVDEVADHLDADAEAASGGLLAVPSVADVRGRELGPGDDDLARALSGRLQRLETDIRLARSLLVSEARYRELAESSRDGIYLRAAGAVTSFPYVNGAGRRLLGELDRPGAPGIDLARVHAGDREELVQRFKLGPWIRTPYRFRLVDHVDGSDRWIEVVETPSAWEGNRVVQVQGTVRDVTAAHRQEAALAAALQREQEATTRLRSVDEMRATFLAAISHELRTPMAGLVGASQTLAAADGRLSSEQADQLAGIVQRQADRVVSLLDDLLDVERLSNGRMGVDPSPVALRAVAKGIVEGMGRDDRFVVTGEDVVVTADRTHVERILHNLLRNAIKHAPSATRIRIHVARTEGGAMLSVEDDGPGIPAEQRERLFQPLVHGPEASSSPSPGVGIGLALVRKFAELHGGRAWVEEGADGGARFLVLLPDEAVVTRDTPAVRTVSGSSAE